MEERKLLLKLTDKQLWALVWALKLAIYGVKKSMKKTKKPSKEYDSLCDLSTYMISAEKEIKKVRASDE